MKRQAVPAPYRDLLASALRETEQNSSRTLKRRRRQPRSGTLSTDEQYDGDCSVPSLSNDDSDVVEVAPKLYMDDSKTMKVTFEDLDTVAADEESEDEFDDDDFEDVDLSAKPVEAPHPYNFSEDTEDNSVTVKIAHTDKKQTKSKRQAAKISTEERNLRIFVHMAYLVAMTVHGQVRSRWCNEAALQKELKKQLPLNIMQAIDDFRRPPPLKRPLEVQLRTRKFLDVLRLLMEYWRRTFKVVQRSHITKRLWSEIGDLDKADRVSRKKFSKQLLKTHRGSRDVAVQGFVALLRALGFQARLVFSLQPPDFTVSSPVERIESKHTKSESEAESKPRPRTKKPPTSTERLLQSLRTGKPVVTASETTSDKSHKEFPVFWCEVWNQHSNKWVSVDPVILRTIEVINGPSQFEPPMTNVRNNAFYVLGYDTKGGVRDITRRYTVSFNAKVRKKRITRTPEGEFWWKRLLLAVCDPKRRFKNALDKIEDGEFEKRSAQEGMPNNVQDFKNHPVYVLEEHLHANEVLQPKISCGMLRKKGTNKSVPVYRRTNVKTVRSAKAWYMRGRVLKTGQRPLIIRDAPAKKTTRNEDNFVLSDDEGDTDVRLYAEEQTEPYVPPPVVNNEVPKNAYGNIDLYTSSMLPAGGAYIGSKFAMKAAKLIGVDYALAVVGFDFTGGKGGVAKMQGVVVSTEYKEAVSVTVEYLEYEEEQAKRLRAEQLALRGWKVFLTRLRIMDRLNAEHGDVEEEAEAEHEEEEEEEEEDDYGGGGFLPESPKEASQSVYEDDVDDASGAFLDNLGFAPDDNEEVGGFFTIDDQGEEGVGSGFEPEEPVRKTNTTQVSEPQLKVESPSESSSSDYDNATEEFPTEPDVGILNDPRNYILSDGESDPIGGTSKDNAIEIEDSPPSPQTVYATVSSSEEDQQEEEPTEYPGDSEGYDFEYSD